MSSLTQLNDRDLVKKYLNGSQASIETLVLRHKTRIFSYIMMHVKNRAIAEDIFQDTFFKVIRTLKRGRYNEEGKFLPWVYRIAHNLVIDYFRKNKRMSIVDGGEDFDIFDLISTDNTNAEQKIVKKQISESVKELIQHLPDEQKEVLMMRLYYDMSFKEIASMTDVSINTALGRMRYALINLRKIIEEKNLKPTLQ